MICSDGTPACLICILPAENRVSHLLSMDLINGQPRGMRTRSFHGHDT